MGLAYAADTRFDILAWGVLQALICMCGVAVALKVDVHDDSPAAAPAPASRSHPKRLPFRISWTRPAPTVVGDALEAAAASPATAVHDPPKPSPWLTPRRVKVANSCVRAAHVVLMLLLAAGAAVCAFAAHALTPTDGRFATVRVDGAPVTLFYKCVDPPTGAGLHGRPRLWLATSSAHGATFDLPGLQHFLALEGWRSCAHDPPGFGLSSRMTGALAGASAEAYLAQLIEAVEPAGAHVALVAIGGGGSAAVALASGSARNARYAFDVKATVLLSVYSPGIDFDDAQRTLGLSNAERDAYRARELASRLGFCQLILGLASPWAPLPIFIPIAQPPGEYYPAARYAEMRVAAWRPQLWVNQYWGLRAIAASSTDAGDPLISAAPLPNTARLAHVLCNAAGEQPCRQPASSAASRRR
jgi:hypothetical protein